MAVPLHESMTDGHCLIIPMQHCSASTLLDEDVCSEIQVFFNIMRSLLGACRSAVGQFVCPVPSYSPRSLSENYFAPVSFSFLKWRWDRYWGRAVLLLANLFALSLVTVPEVFAKINSPHVSFSFLRDGP